MNDKYWLELKYGDFRGQIQYDHFSSIMIKY